MNITSFIRLGCLVTAVGFLHPNATADTIINYGSASSFAVLADSGISDAGGSAITGDVGVSPAAGTSITGLLPGQVGGTIYNPDGTGPGVMNPGLLTNAKNDFSSAYTAAGGLTPTFANLGLQLGGQSLKPGVYTFDPGTVLLGGTLTLNANGVLNPIWIFQAKSDLTTGSGSRIVFENGGVPCDVLWRVPTQATLGSDSLFVGTIMAGSAIVMQNNATLYGRAWAETAVTLDHNTITGLPCTSISDTGDTGGNGGNGGNGGTVPDSGSTLLLLGSGVASLLAFRRRFFSPA